MTSTISSTPGGVVSSSRSLNQQLLEAAKNGDNEEVCRLILLDDEDGQGNVVDVNTKDKRGYTLLHYCSNRTYSRPDDGETIRLILEKGAMVEARNHEGCTPLHYASKNGLVDTASVLLETGAAHANSKNVFEWTPLMYCAEHNQAKVACLLLGKGASVHTKNRAGCTSLHYASMAGHVSIIHLLLGMGADIHARRKVDGKTPLELAKNEETVRVLYGSSLPLPPVQAVSSLQAALQQPQESQQQQSGSSTQQQPQGGGASSLQAALRQTQQQTAAVSIITAASSKSSTSTNSTGTTNTGTKVMDKRLDALVQKQEHLTVSLQDQVNRLEMLLVSASAQYDKDDTTITMMDNDDLQQENSKTAVVAPVKTITIQGKGINRTKKNARPQRQQDSKVPATGRYSLTIGSHDNKQQPKQSNDNCSIGDSNRHLNRTVLVPIGTNSDGTTTGNNSCANSQAPSTNRTSSPRRLTDFVVPPRTPPKAKPSNFVKHNNKNHSSTADNNEYSPPLEEEQKNRTRVNRSGLMERMKMYERDAAGVSRHNDAGSQQHNNKNMSDNDEKQIKRRGTNQI